MLEDPSIFGLTSLPKVPQWASHDRWYVGMMAMLHGSHFFVLVCVACLEGMGSCSVGSGFPLFVVHLVLRGQMDGVLFLIVGQEFGYYVPWLESSGIMRASCVVVGLAV